MDDSHNDRHDKPDSPRRYRRLEPFDHHHHHKTAAHKDGSSRAWPSKKGAMIVSRRVARRVERCCCLGAHYFPLAFVYGLSSWAAWVMVQLDRRVASDNADRNTTAGWVGPGYTAATLALWGMQLWSYSTAVFTAPGSTTDDRGYSTVPASSSSSFSSSSLTVKSNGELRFCKKCQARKPDRAHHCSTCRRCVLKMDHHCPWLATCIGLRNAKAFVLFLVYTTLFALACLAASASWVWAEVASDATYATYDDSMLPIQIIVLCVISGIIGLVVGLFTCWHLYLACRGQTTIECMEKTRYQSPLRRHAAAAASFGANPGRHHHRLPDVEQGLGPIADDNDDDDDDDDDDNNNNDSNRHFNDTDYNTSSSTSSTPQLGRRLTYDQLERYRAQKRHQEYLDEQDSKLLPHAFDLGTRLNLLHLLGPRPWLWALPICNTTGDGWSWKPSPRWLAARDRIQRERDEQQARERAAGWGPVEEEGDEDADDDNENSNSNSNSNGFIHYGSHPAAAPPPRYSSRPSPQPQASLYSSPSSSAAPAPTRFSTSKADRILGRDPRLYSDEKPRAPAPASASSNALASFSSPSPPPPQSTSAVSMQRLSAAGRALRRGQLPRILDDSILDELDDDDDEDDEEERRQRAKDEAAAAEAAAARRLQHQQTHLALAPLRARWLPQRSPGASGASGLLLRKAATAGPHSASTSPLGSPGAGPGSGPGSGSGSDSGPASPLLETVSLASRADTDDGGVD